MKSKTQNLEIFFIIYFIYKVMFIHTHNKNIVFRNNNLLLQKSLDNDKENNMLKNFWRQITKPAMLDYRWISVKIKLP